MSNTINPAERTPVEGAKNRTQAHLWLHRSVGEWTTETEAMDPEGNKFTTTGTESIRKLGEYWIVNEIKGIMPDDNQPAEMVVAIGYDIKKGKFVGSWVGSMMENLWVYEGEMDENGALNLYSEGEDMMDESKTAVYRDQISWESDDVRLFTSSAKDEKGEWFSFMTVRSTRVK